MNNRRTEPRFLCAELVKVRVQDEAGLREETCNLEDISPSGACVQLEAAAQTGADIELTCAQCSLRGKVRYCVSSPLGYDVGIAFDQRKSWSPQRFKPKHILFATPEEDNTSSD